MIAAMKRTILVVALAVLAVPSSVVASTPPTTTTTTTLPVAKGLPPITYNGHGDYVVDLGPSNSRFVGYFKHTGSSNFIVTALDASTERLDGVVNEIGAWDGTVLVSVSDFAKVRYLEIKADGDWQVDMIDLSALLKVSDKFGAHGSYVLLYDGPGGIFDVTHNGESNFIVHAMTSDDFKGVINEIGPYTGRVILPPGLAMIDVKADGDWSFTPVG